MRLLQLNVFAGPSLYAQRPSLRAHLDGGSAGDLAADILVDRIEHSLSSTAALSASLVQIKTLITGSGPIHWADAYGALSIALQEDRFEKPLAYRVSAATNDQEKFIFIETNDPPLGQQSAHFAAELVRVFYDENWDQIRAQASEQLDKAIQDFARIRSAVRLNENNRVLVEAAQKRGVPVLPLVRNSEIMVLGQGHKARRLYQFMADTSSAVGVRVIAHDKVITCQVLREAGVPVPRHFVVRTKDELTHAVEQLGFPLVVKGATSNRGVSVSTGVSTNEQLQIAIKKVQQFKTDIIVEQQIAGEDYRLTVIGGRVAAAARRSAAQVVGDGKSSIGVLIENENHRRRSFDRFANTLVPLRLDDDAMAVLARQGYDGDTIPPTGEAVALRSVGNLSQGGLAEDVTDLVHPDVARVAERAARLVGLDMAGVDIMTTDIRRSLSETDGAILEVNYWPGMRLHYVTPTEPRDIAGAVIDYLFPDDSRGRIPTVAVTGTNGKTTTCRMLRRVFETDGRVVGLCTTDEMIIDGKTIVRDDCAGAGYACMILKDPVVEAGVFEMARGGLIRRGTRVDSYSVGVVTNVTSDHIGLEGIETLKQMARVKRLIAELARDGVVLNADDELCVAMAAHVTAPIWWFTENAGNKVVQTHLRRGGKAVIVTERDGREVLLKCSAETESEIVATADIPATWHGLIRVNVSNAAAAAAAALAAGLEMETVRRALQSFSTQFDDSPGRFNIHEANGITVILDNAHNTDGVKQMSELLERIPQDGKKLCFFATDTSRSQSHCEQVAAALAHQFDHYIISDQTPLAKRRHETEVTDWLSSGLLGAGVAPESIEATTEVWAGIDRVLSMARPGDTVFVKVGADKSAYWNAITGFELSGSA